MAYSCILGQYAAPAGMPGTSAIHKDSSVFKSWAKHSQIFRGPMDISDPSLGYPSIGDSSSCLGKSNGMLVSLGDGGEAILSFELPIFNGPSWDFAVFENSFVNDFLELAFVEVSSDGQNFFRFPASSLTQDSSQIGSFGTIDARKVNNLAGKYEANYGTPFDLEELANIPGLDLQNISHIKIIDVIGSLNPLYASSDTAGNFINDPWPTPFPSSGFDLESVGVIHSKGFGIQELQSNFEIYPNPALDFIHLKSHDPNLNIEGIEVLNSMGQVIEETKKEIIRNDFRIDLANFDSGIYFIQIQMGADISYYKFQIL